MKKVILAAATALMLVSASAQAGWVQKFSTYWTYHDYVSGVGNCKVFIDLPLDFSVMQVGSSSECNNPSRNGRNTLTSLLQKKQTRWSSFRTVSHDHYDQSRFTTGSQAVYMTTWHSRRCNNGPSTEWRQLARAVINNQNIGGWRPGPVRRNTNCT